MHKNAASPTGFRVSVEKVLFDGEDMQIAIND